MNKTISIVISLLFCLHGGIVMAQGQGDALMKKAQDFLAQKEYTKARSTYLHAYNAFASAAHYDKATACGAKVASLYYRENYYKEAFDMLRAADQLIAQCEQNSHKARPDLRYATTKERLQMYTRLRKAVNAKEQLTRLDDLAKASANDSLLTDLLYTKASHYYTFGLTAQGDAAINLLIGKYKDAKQYDKVIDCYQTLIAFARKSGNAAMTSRTYEQYIMWKDSVRVLKAQDELAALKKECADKQAAIDDRDSSLATRQYIIVALCILAAALAVTLVLGGIVLIRFVMTTRRQKKAIAVANENIELKAAFIRNISAQLSPTLDLLDGAHPAVGALKQFMTHVGQLSELEAHLAEPCDMQERNIATFCDGIAKQMEGKMKSGVRLVVNAPKLTMPVNADMLEHVLLHLLNNAAFHTPEGGKITLDYKKRGAHTHQFIVSDTGPGIDAELRPVLFKPFAHVADLTQGDGLGLPICALMAIRMNGTLTLDESYTKSARFILELHT